MKSQNPNPEKILVRGVNWLGDAVMSTPALLRLREKFPAAHIALLTPEKLRELWQHHPAMNEVISIAPGENVFSVGKRLSAEKFDLALVLPNSHRSALEVFLAEIPRRVGYARPWRNSFLTQTVAPCAGMVEMQKRSIAEIHELIRSSGPQAPPPSSSHQIHEYLHLVAALGANPEVLPPQLYVDKLEVLGLDWSLPQNGPQPDFIIGLNPGAEYGSAKRWPIENFAAVANELYRRVSCQFLIFGGKNDVLLAEHLCELLPVPRANRHICLLAGKTNLRDLMAALTLCHVLLTNDTGPMHVAAALGTPVVVPFGSTSPELTGPGLPGGAMHQLIKSDAPCSPCFLRECPIDFRCMNGISVERVIEAVLDYTGRA